MASESHGQLSNAEKRARLAGAAARRETGTRDVAGSGSAGVRSGTAYDDATKAGTAAGQPGRMGDARRQAARLGDETAGETPAQRRKRLAVGIALGLVVVIAVVVVIMFLAPGHQI